MSLLHGVGAGLGGSGDAGGALGSFFSTSVDNSLRLTSANSSRLTFSQGSPTDISKWTVNFWLKRSSPLEDTSDYDTIFGVNGPGNTAFTFLGGQIYLFVNYNDGGSQARLITNRVFRDPSAWYNFHVTFDRANGTAAQRLRLYVNGVEETSFSTDERSSIASDSSTGWNVSGANAAINSRSGDNADRFHDGYLAQFYNIDGAVVAPTEFAETKDGVWIPKAYSGSYGNNGWLLEFKQTGTGTASSSTVGADTSGNNNHWTSSGIAAHDVMLDSPTNNFATMNSIYHSALEATLLDGNLKVDTAGFNNSANNYGAVSTFAIPKDKKIYLEVECTDATGASWYAGFATQSGLESGTSSTNVGGASAVTLYNRAVMKNGTQFQYSSSSGLGGLGGGTSPLQAGDILGMAVDGSNGNVWLHKNGSYFKTIASNNGSTGNVGDPSANTDPVATIDNVPAEDLFVVIGGNTSASAIFVNFGQDSQNVASANADGEGIGTFEYAPPTGYVALCSSNLTTPAIGPTESSQADDYFNSVIYTGNAGSQSITVGFQPDWLWFKSRSNADPHELIDSVRGATKRLRSNATTAESTASSGDGFASIDSSGFTLNSDGGGGQVNGSSRTYVAWNWKAGGAPSADNTAGNGATPTANSVKIDGSNLGSALAGSLAATRLSANTTAGFSIVIWDASGVSTGTMAHGLTVAPDLIIAKNRNHGTNWFVQVPDILANTHILNLETTSAAFNPGVNHFNDTVPTNEVFSFGGYLGGHSDVSSNTQMIAYCFHSVSGYSSVGSYLGNGSTDGPFVFTGFRPAFVFTKESSDTSGWNIRDSARSPENVVNEVLQPNTSDAEMTSNYDVDFLSNGFKLRASASDSNTSSQRYIYLAFAEAPFKFANAR